MGTIDGYNVQKSDRRIRGYWAPDGALETALQAVLYIAGAPAGEWKFEVGRQVKCASGTPAFKFDSVKPDATVFTANIRAETGGDARFEVTVHLKGAPMPTFNTECLTHAAMVYSTLAKNPKQRRLAMAALPNGIVFSRLAPEMGAMLLVALGLDSKVPVDIVLRSLVVQECLCEIAPLVYAAVRPNKERLRDDIEGLKPETLITLRQLLAGVEKKGIDGQKRVPTVLSRAETGMLDDALLHRLQEQVPGIVFLGNEGDQVYEPICEIAARIVASLGQKSSLPPDEVAAAEQRVTLAAAEHERLQKELDCIRATHPDLEVMLEESTRLCERLEAELATARDVQRRHMATFEAKRQQLLTTQRALEAAESEAMDAMADQDAIKERQEKAKEAKALQELDELFAAIADRSGVSIDRLRQLASEAP